MNRALEIFLVLMVLIVLFPLLIIIALVVSLDSRGGPFYQQARVGKNNTDFQILKFRTMIRGADRKGLLTTGNDLRVTQAGRFLRKYKLDELPQLLNILKGEMGIVGPRPEVRKYVDLYSPEQMKVLSVRPGLTDYASLEYFEEAGLLAGVEDPEQVYIETIMPAKLELNLKYIREKSVRTDLVVIFKTIGRIFSAP